MTGSVGGPRAGHPGCKRRAWPWGDHMGAPLHLGSNFGAIDRCPARPAIAADPEKSIHDVKERPAGFGLRQRRVSYTVDRYISRTSAGCNQAWRLLLDVAPEAFGDGAVGGGGAAGRDELGLAAAQVAAGDREQADGAQILRYEEVRHMAPAHALQDDLALHQLIAHGPAAGALDQEVVAPGRVPRGVADDALRVVAHLLGRDRLGDREGEEPGCHDWDELHSLEID